jgi:hypothetical protein
MNDYRRIKVTVGNKEGTALGQLQVVAGNKNRGFFF